MLNEPELLRDLQLELADPEYVNLRHGERHTRNMGCVGPLCRKALRDWKRDRTAAAAAMRGTSVRARRRSIDVVRMDQILTPLKAAHDKEFDSRNREVAGEELQTPPAQAPVARVIPCPVLICGRAA